MKIFFSAGEASGDALGASLLRALQRHEPRIEAVGMGGPAMVQAGLHLLRDARELNVVGLVEVLRHLPRLYRLLWDLAARGLEQKPDVAVLIDVPDFNVRLARYFRRAGIPVVFYVGPSVWAWRSGRVRRFRRVIERMLVLFPFETEIWRGAGVDTRCVGHPLIDEIPAARRQDQVERGTIALLPGSRSSELRRLLPVMLEAGALLVARGKAERFVLPVAPTVDPTLLKALIAASGLGERVELIHGTEARRAALARAELALVASGTATLETALCGTPQVIVYRVSPLSWWIGRRLVRVPFLGLPNLISGREIVPELLQADLHPESLASKAAELLADPGAQLQSLSELRAALGPRGAAELAAEAVLELVRKSELKPLSSSSPAS